MKAKQSSKPKKSKESNVDQVLNEIAQELSMIWGIEVTYSPETKKKRKGKK